MIKLYINTAIMSGLFLLVFGLAEFAYVKFKLKVEFTRKFVHISSGLMCMSFPFFIQNKWLVLLLTINFFVLLLVSIKFKFLKAINDVERKTYGSFLFPVTISILYFLSKQLGIIDFYYLPLLIFALSDPIGALVGGKYPLKKYTLFNQQKSIGGGLAFFISAFIVGLIYFYFTGTLDVKTIIILCAVSIVTTITEGISFKGTDNITVPLMSALVLYLVL